MKLGKSFVLAVAVMMPGAVAVVAVAADLAGRPDGNRWWSHVVVLADDALEGRNTGSAGHRKAAVYVAAQFEKAGLRPAGTEGYFQPVQFRTIEIDEGRSRLALVRTTGTDGLTFGEDAFIVSRVDPAPEVEADLVFAGYGLRIPEHDHDDFRGLDVKGKVVVYLSGPPPSVPASLAAHMQSTRERSALLASLGAVGTVAIPNPKHMDIPWERLSLARSLPSMRLADPAFDENPGQKIAIAVNPARADRWLAGSGHSFREILDAADAGRPLPRFAIPARLRARVAARRGSVESQNVAAVLPGRDPKLRDESVVFSAHLDHLGVGKPIRGDAIYNGAMDNASGIATLLEIAAALKESGKTLRRSVVFVAVTGEEKGLLGSRKFAANPPPAAGTIVADINVDMFLPLYPFKLLTVYGMDESDLGAEAAAAARSCGVVPQPDPEPKRNLFIRSDQYSFIRRGIPSLALKVGFARGSPEEKTAKAWLTERYHAPSDDTSQPVDKTAAAEFNALVAALLERVANREQAPRWKETSFFRRFAQEKPSRPSRAADPSPR